MTIKIPKDLRGFAYDRVLPIDVNSFDVDVLLPPIFFRVLSDGQNRGRNANDPTKIGEFVGRLAAHPDVLGFEGAARHRVLERLVRTSLVQIGRTGTSRSSEQIDGLTCYTFLAFKAGLPSERSRIRRVDELIYRMMRDQLRSKDSLREFFEAIFGKGVRVRGGAEPTGNYDGQTELDTITRLSIAFLDGFEPTGVRNAKERTPREVCPAIANSMARDLRQYLEAYRDRMPIEALAYYFKALINIELFTYTLKLFWSVADLVEGPSDLPAAMRQQAAFTPPEIYVDFTGAAAGPSREMAASCVRRDLESIQRFVAANLTLRQLDLYVHSLRGNRRLGQIIASSLPDDDGGPEYLRALLGLLDEPSVAARIEAAAAQDEDAIRRENALSPQDQDGDENDQPVDEIEQVAGLAESDFERLVLLLMEGQRTTITKNIVSWFWAVGGLTKPHGILTGHLKSRQSWRYAPSNDLLAVLVQLAAVDIPKWDKENPAPRPVRLRDFLEWLELRFGILVDRPPEGFGGAEYVAAAQDNLRAMLRRLRQMGVFRDLSDDFTVQRLTPPYVSVDEERQPA